MEWLKRQFRDYFGFSSAEIKGVWVLLILLIGLLILYPLLSAYFRQQFPSTHVLDTGLLNRTLAHLESQQIKRLPLHGQDGAAVKTFRTTKDAVGNVIPLAAFDINIADTQQLITLPGIGKVRAEKIINYRDKLGGFIHQRQYQEVYGLDDVSLHSLYQYAYIAANFQPKKISINTDSFNICIRHPYFSYAQVRSLLVYRKKQGPFKDMKALRINRILDEATWKKIGPYLTL